MNIEKLYNEVYEFCLANYDKGYDTFIECYSKNELIEYIKEYKIKSVKGFIKDYAPVLDVYEDRKAEADYQISQAGQDHQLIKYHIKDRKPEDNSYVLIHLTIDNWGDRDNPEGKRYWRVAKFVRGISQEERELLSDNDKRKGSLRSGDEYGNNQVAYVWDEFGPSTHFGQNVDYWCELPN